MRKLYITVKSFKCPLTGKVSANRTSRPEILHLCWFALFKGADVVSSVFSGRVWNEAVSSHLIRILFFGGGVEGVWCSHCLACILTSLLVKCILGEKNAFLHIFISKSYICPPLLKVSCVSQAARLFVERVHFQSVTEKVNLCVVFLTDDWKKRYTYL